MGAVWHKTRTLIDATQQNIGYSNTQVDAVVPVRPTATPRDAPTACGPHATHPHPASHPAILYQPVYHFLKQL